MFEVLHVVGMRKYISPNFASNKHIIYKQLYFMCKLCILTLLLIYVIITSIKYFQNYNLI